MTIYMYLPEIREVTYNDMRSQLAKLYGVKLW